MQKIIIMLFFIMNAQASKAVDCTDPETQIDINDCEIEASSTQQRQLDNLVEELQSRFDKQEREMFVWSHKTWESVTKAHCSWVKDLFKGGSVAPIQYSTCIEKHAKDRIENLKLLLCEGWGMTGECKASRKYSGA